MTAKLTVEDVVETLEPRLGAVRELDEPQGIDQLALLVLARDASQKRARTELRRLQQDFVDWNDVRVTSVYELAARFEASGDKAAMRRAEELVDLMSTLYLRFNKMTVDVAVKPDASPEDGKRRARLLAFLTEKLPLYGALMQLHGAAEEDVVASPEITRTLVRLGFLEGRPSDSAAREALLRRTKPGGRIAAQFVLHQLAARHCFAKAPDCAGCPLSARCPSSEAKPAAQGGKTAKPAKAAKAAAPPKPKTAKARPKAK